jgi:GPH family glycoside/pentoside/hexuronide:cation symporter
MEFQTSRLGNDMDTQLTMKRTLLYSSASAGLNIMAISVSTWLLYFYSPPPDSGRHIYLPITLVGVLMTITSLWDAIIDPFIGHFSDVTRSRWGRRRPYILFVTPITAILLLFIFTPPGGASIALNAAYFFIIITLFYTAYSLVGIPYDGTMPEMAHTPKELVRLSTWKNILGILGVMVGALVAAPLFSSIGPLAMAGIVAVVGLATIWLALLGIRETTRPIGEPMPVVEGIKATLKNRQFMFMFVSVLIVHVAYAMVTAILPYFITTVLGRSEADVGIFQGLLVLLMILSAPVWNWLARRYAHRKLLMSAMLLMGFIIALNAFVGLIPGIDKLIQAYITVGLVGPVLGGYFILAYAMMGSVVDYDEMSTHARREAIYYGTFSLAAGIGPAAAALILPIILSQFGYTTANPLGVRVAWVVAGLCSLLGALAFLGYRLGDTPEQTRINMGLPEILSLDETR